MSDTVLVNKLRDTKDSAAYLLCSSTDGTGESKVQKIDISAIVMAATKVKIRKLKWSIVDMAVTLFFDHSTDDTAIILTGNGELNGDEQAPILDPGSAGGTGDILLSSTVTAATVGKGYTIYIEIEKVA